jgi:hypothetical protein
VDLGAKIKEYYKFTPAEIRAFIISILVLSFIISFRDWGEDRFNLMVGLFNWFNAALIVTLVLLIYNGAQRIAGLSVGFNAEYKMWIPGLLLGLVFSFASKGRIWVLLPGGIVVHHLAGHRLGYFRYGLHYFTHGMVAVAGTIAVISLAALFKIINAAVQSSLLEKLILFCIIFAIYDILPIPPLSGSKLFFGSRMTYAFMFFTIVIAGILLLIDINVLMAVVGSLAIGIICWLLYYMFFERKAWGGPWPK